MCTKDKSTSKRVGTNMQLYNMVYSKLLVQVRDAERVYSGVRVGGGWDVGQGRHGCHGDGTTDTDTTRSLSTSLPPLPLPLHPPHPYVNYYSPYPQYCIRYEEQ